MKHVFKKKCLLCMVFATAMLMLTGCTSTSRRAQEAAEEYLAEEKYEKAIEELTTVITKADLDKAEEIDLMINGYYLRAECYEKLGDTENAAADFEKALQEDLRERSVTTEVTSVRYLRRGLVYVSKEDYASALAAFQAGLSCSEVSCRQELLRNEICCLEKIGDFDKACSEAEIYSQEFPADTEMVQEYYFLKSRREEKENAENSVKDAEESAAQQEAEAAEEESDDAYEDDYYDDSYDDYYDDSYDDYYEEETY